MKTLYLVAILMCVSVPIYAEGTLVIAHRGASKHAPENTIPAFKLAWEQGADGIEADFRQTKDGRIVCIHDKNTNRVGDKKLNVKDSLFQELRSVDVGTYSKYSKTIIPTIAEVFATIPEQGRIYVEIKSGRTIIPNLLKEITKSGLKQEQIIIISFNPKVIFAFKTKAPQYKALWLSGFKKDRSGKITPSIQKILSTLRRIKADGFCSSKKIDESSIKIIMEKGYECHVWTVDSVKVAKRFKKWGAGSIITNFPGYIRERLGQN